MGSKTKHFPSFSIVNGDIQIKVSFSRFEKQFEKAQYVFDSAIMTSMIPYMPQNSGTFINLTRAQSAALAGSGTVIAGAAPMGRFLYGGLAMIDPETGSAWARKGAKKVVTDKPLNYSNPKAQSHWFDVAKAKDGKKWVDTVKRIAGGG